MNLTQPNLKFNLVRNFFLALLGLLMVFYVFQLNELTQGMDAIKRYNQNIERISKENNTLDAEFSRKNSLESLRMLVANLSFEKVGKIDYIKIPEDAFVRR